MGKKRLNHDGVESFQWIEPITIVYTKIGMFFDKGVYTYENFTTKAFSF